MKCFKFLLIVLFASGLLYSEDSRSADTVAQESANFRQNIEDWRYEMTREWNEHLVDDVDSIYTFLDRVFTDSINKANIAGVETLEFESNASCSKASAWGILRTSIVTIGHVGETTTDWAFTTAANTTQQAIGADTIPAYARILDVCIITTQAVAGITTSFTVRVGTSDNSDIYGVNTDMKAVNALIGGDASEAILEMPSSSVVVIHVSATPSTENWSAMSAGEFSLITTYLDYGAIK